MASIRAGTTPDLAHLEAEVRPKGALRASGVGLPALRVQHAFGAWMALLFAPIRNGMELVFALVRNEMDVVFTPLNNSWVAHTTRTEGSLRSNLSY